MGLIDRQQQLGAHWQTCTKRTPPLSGQRPVCELGPLDRLDFGIRENCDTCPWEGSRVGKVPLFPQRP